MDMQSHVRGVLRSANEVLERTTGRRLVRTIAGRRTPLVRNREDRLVRSPVFLLSSVRSGSTLLRVILNTHSQITAPHELHLRALHVKVKGDYAERSVTELGFDERRLEYLLWDRVLHRELMRSGKSLIVDKTPNNVFIWERLAEAWPDARYIVLLRHPAGIADSLFRATADPVEEEVVKRVLEYGEKLEEARRSLPAITVRYEDLVADAEAVTRSVCEHLGVAWEPGMLDYGAADHGPFAMTLGDWSDKIRSGTIQSDIVIPRDDEVPPSLKDLVRRWGYAAQAPRTAAGIR